MRELKSLTIVPNGTVTANDTNYATITLATGATTLAEVTTETTGTGDWVAGTAIAMTLSSDDIAAAGSLKLTVAKEGTGVQLPRFEIVAEWR